MKYRIRKMQEGGGFSTYTPILPMPQATPVGGQSGQEPKEDSSSLLDENLYKELVSKGGLINDVNWFVNQLEQIENSPSMLMSSDNRRQSLQLVAKINELKRHKERWDSSLQEASENDALGEAAIGANGELYERDAKGNIKTLSISDYRKKPEKYNILSVSDLMDARQSDPQLTMNTSAFVTAERSIGLSKIDEHVRGIISAIGTESFTSDKSYSKKDLAAELQKVSGKSPSSEELKGLELIYQAASTPGEYVDIKTTDKSSRNHLDKALDYLWSTLNTNAKRKLEVSSIQSGAKNSKQLLLDMIIAGTNEEQSVEITPRTPSSVEGSSGSSELKSATAFQMFHKDMLKSPNLNFIFNDPKLNVLFRGAIGSVGPLLTKDDEVMGMTTLGGVLKQHDYGSFLDLDNVFFGDKEVRTLDLDKIVYNGSEAAKVYMPTKADGSADFEAFKEFKEVYAVYEANKNNWTKQQAENHFQKNSNFRIYIDEVGGEKVIRDNPYIKPFLVMYGYTNDAVAVTDDNNFIHELKGREEKEVKQMLENLWTVKNGSQTINLTPDASWNREDYYEGMITIPYRQGAAAIINSLSGQGPLDTKSTYKDVYKNLNYSSNQPFNEDASAFNLNNN